MDAELKEAVRGLTESDLSWLLENLQVKDQIFTFISSETDKTIHVNVTKLVMAIDAKGVKSSFRFMALTEHLYQLILTKQGVERAHIDKNISYDEAAYDPAVILEDGDTHIIVDGNHKIVKAFEMGLRRRPAIFVPYDEIDPYMYEVPARVSNVMQVCTKQNVQFSREIMEEIVTRKRIN